MKPFSFAIDLPVQNQWRNVDLLRTSVQNCFIAVFADLDGCHAIAMVTGELVENAVKYGDWTGNANSFRLRVFGKLGEVTVQVDNPIAPGSEHYEQLQQTLKWIGEYASAEAAYRAKLLEIANQPKVESSGLGLVRCAYEGNARMTAELVDGGTTSRVVATMAF